MDHEDSAALVVLGNLLRNGFLHRAIREQGGAYGGGASQDSNSGAFRFTLTETRAWKRHWRTLIKPSTGLCTANTAGKALKSQSSAPSAA